MSSVSLASRKGNPLFLPLVIVSGLAVAQAVTLMVLLVILARRGPPPPAATETAPPRAAVAAAGATEPAQAARPLPPPPVAAALPHGKRGQRVESGGFAITLENIVRDPPNDPLGQVNAEQRYLALLLRVENETGNSVSFYDVMFRLQDGEGYEYKPLAMKLIAPALDYRHLGNRESIRGYVDFIVPRSSKKLTLIYTHLAQPIHIDLEE